MRFFSINSLSSLAMGLALFATIPVIAQNDLGPLSDEFDNATSLSNWQRLNETEQWFTEQLENFDINTTETGRMIMMPYTVVWFQEYRGPLVYKEVTGDFVVTADVRSTGRDGTSVPQTEFSLSGLMVRTPRAITPGTWTPGGENYVFLSLGHGNNGGVSFQFEIKTTTNSNSNLTVDASPADSALLQIARLGVYVIVLRKPPGQPWEVHRRYNRSDMPATVQIGAVTYTNWEKCQDFAATVHDANVLNPPLPMGVTDPTPGEAYIPDVLGSFDYIRFFRPTLPANLQGVDMTNTGLVSDAELIAFLADTANVPDMSGSAVPAMSTWGSLVLIALVVLAGSVILRRRKEVTTAN